MDRNITASPALAPSAANMQPWRFLVTDKNIVI
ncbi:hypothetical protein [Gordoniibacillus kamchatkensis]|nr:hypothetical protein [Paenibacillus sp. VKM B-2647]